MRFGLLVLTFLGFWGSTEWLMRRYQPGGLDYLIGIYSGIGLVVMVLVLKEMNRIRLEERPGGVL